MSTKWNFTQAKNKLKNDEDIISYFILVESYEKYINSSQESKFLNPDSIDEMINLLDEKQLEHLKSLIKVFFQYKYHAHWDTHGRGVTVDQLSEWFKENIYQNENLLKKFGSKPLNIQEECQSNCMKLYKKIKSVIQERLKIKNVRVKQLAQYKTRLRKFDGNSMEYRQWLTLFVIDHGIPGIDRVHDIDKLLRRLSIEYLKRLKDKLARVSPNAIMRGIKNLEPYFYQSAADDMDDSIDSSGSLILKRTNPEYKAFNIAIKNLIFKIESIIAKKIELNISEIIDSLPTSAKFYDDMETILDAVEDKDNYLKNVIEEYSKASATGSVFNRYLRKAVLLERLSKAEVSVSDIRSFRNKVLKARKYFLNHLTSKNYTVYRGMGLNGLPVLLKTAEPQLSNRWDNGNLEPLIEEINKKKPVVFDEGFLSTSLDKEIAAQEFEGKSKEGVFFTIKIPAGSKALVLDYENIDNIPYEEEVLLDAGTKIKINSIKDVQGHYEIDAVVVG